MLMEDNTLEILRNINLDIEFYKSFNPDLQHLCSHELVLHYTLFGKNEGRFANKSDFEIDFYKHNPDFDAEFYKSCYPDLQHLCSQDLLLHYTLFGKNEGRVINPEFDVEFYKSYYPDLQHLCSQDLLLHYTQAGKKEGRIMNRLHLEKTLYAQYCGNTEYKESIYIQSFPQNIYNLLDKLEKDNIKILISNNDYVESSGGGSVLHYLCHLLNYVAKRNIAFMVPLRNKPISQYTLNDCKLATNPKFITPCVTPEILLNRNNIVVYPEGIGGNPLEQKHVVRWILYLVPSIFISSWKPTDLIMWYIDTYQKYSKNLQKLNNEVPIQAGDITNKQIICHIISHVKEILNMGNVATNKKGICYTTRKAGNNINVCSKLLIHENENNDVCNNCQKQIWPCVCQCENYANGVKLVHNNELVYRFESPVNVFAQIELFKNTERFYMYDPFCFSAVIAGLNNCLTIVPTLDIFEQNNPYENVPWMKYGISYGNDIESIQTAEQTLPSVTENITKILYDINYDNINIFFSALDEMVYS